MTTPSIATSLTCTQCGGELHPDEGQIFLTCPFCSSTVYLDKSRVVFHWFLEPTLNEDDARSALARWMAGNDTVKDLDKKARLTDRAFHYFPLWYFKQRSGQREHIYLEPAAATSVTELRNLALPAGDLRKYDDSIGAQAESPTVPLVAALDWLTQKGVADNEVAESALVHVPIYTFKYDFQGRAYTAVVEGATGKTLANIFPAKAEAPYLTVGCVTAAVFMCLAGILAAGIADLAPDYLLYSGVLCVGGGTIAAAILFGVASWVAAKV